VALKDAALACPRANNVLVLGCGRGLVEYLLTEGWHCTSVDISEKQIEAAREINRFKNNRTFYVDDLFHVRSIPANSQFNLVIISEVIEHLDNDRGALRVAYDRLEPGGHFILTVPNQGRFHNALRKMFGREPFLMTSDHVREYTVNHVSELLKLTGFVIEGWRGVWFEFPRPGLCERFIDPSSRLRAFLAWLFPHWATYILLVCHKPATAVVAVDAAARAMAG
jgi:SAM-dependent methyltransferase